ncbi:phosphoenolpyruvate carboxykinase (ATP) [Halalkalibacter akibai]|uniref:Phosphoenolpyruvate carboxykinase (ATP) n=1 Tax=Halalkalibacter akibai (strain ATCC 43226 / DSM 21942 / CIP 109018 / JCM 9157 / 1139) TaxID=1236973 RepID=W4QRE9_HALA3|nr:phosphoenolpyruvate carboxykinase (ATP) [Halalkalibacter akibai]GAE34223.1 phosphoenolpyruvate carboxykinase [Halalkalibacter akibai JCM 9157]
MNMVSLQSELINLVKQTNVQFNLPVSSLIEKSLMRGEGTLTSTGALAVETGAYTGRSPKDKFIVHEPNVADKIDWGTVNQPFSADKFTSLYQKVLTHLHEKEELFVSDGYAGADPSFRLPLRIINEFAWHQVFARQLFIRPTELEHDASAQPFSIISAPTFKADPVRDGTASEAFVIISFEERIVLIGGTEYAGEMKKSIFSVMNFFLPEQDVLSMHCSANVGREGDVALFFGLSGTGKTTLSADPNRSLIGDDEHGWSANGVFNIEGGCYAKCANLSQEKEPQIWNAIRFGSVLENVIVDSKTGQPDYDNISLTENTRAAYAIEEIPNALSPSVAGHPNTIVFLTADAFGVLPPISKLTKEQAMYHFLSGYTSKLAGTERGITSPEATFSTCFGAPFLPLPAARYAEMLGDRIDQHDTEVYLVNTGWSGGPYGIGKRINLKYTRAMIQAALSGELRQIETTTDEHFGLHIPLHVPGVPDHVLEPRHTWEDQTAFDLKAQELADNFKENFLKFGAVSDQIKAAGPR